MKFFQKSNFFLSVFFTEIILEKIIFDIVARRKWFKRKKL